MRTHQRSFLTFSEAARFARETAQERSAPTAVRRRPDGWWTVSCRAAFDVPDELESDPFRDGYAVASDEVATHWEDEDPELLAEYRERQDASRREYKSLRYREAIAYVYSKPLSHFVDEMPFDDSELAEIAREQSEYVDDQARSEEDGWFYSDD